MCVNYFRVASQQTLPYNSTALPQKQWLVCTILLARADCVFKWQQFQLIKKRLRRTPLRLMTLEQLILFVIQRILSTLITLAIFLVMWRRSICYVLWVNATNFWRVAHFIVWQYAFKLHSVTLFLVTCRVCEKATNQRSFQHLNLSIKSV